MKANGEPAVRTHGERIANWVGLVFGLSIASIFFSVAFGLAVEVVSNSAMRWYCVVNTGYECTTPP